MSEFDKKAAEWDNNPMHTERSRVIAESIKKDIPLNRQMSALEFGAGTGTTSFFLANDIGEITMVDNSPEMVKRTKEKIILSGLKNLKVIEFDLVNNNFNGGFDLIFTQMVLHHIPDIRDIILKFHDLLNNDGYLAIADLYSEDGSFHGAGFEGHNGFDPGELAGIIRTSGFKDISYSKCFTVQKDIAGQGKKQFDVFILTCKRSD
ncbi:MAG TPA: class I SAM-dependent methyltransferase [Bacteroidales bacterium]|nr:class I SAM-dependent methyltransferase [Bacteroidales bacterium]